MLFSGSLISIILFGNITEHQSTLIACISSPLQHCECSFKTFNWPTHQLLTLRLQLVCRAALFRLMILPATKWCNYCWNSEIVTLIFDCSVFTILTYFSSDFVLHNVWTMLLWVTSKPHKCNNIISIDNFSTKASSLYNCLFYYLWIFSL